MINPKQLRDLITRILKEIPHGYSEDAVELLMMIAAHESNLGTYLSQANGPALGIFQIEPITHDDTWENGDSICDNAQLLGIECAVEKLEYDLRYQIFMARQKLFMVSEAIPSNCMAMKMAEYCKKYWNTEHGKATAYDYHKAYLDYCLDSGVGYELV
jgi:hypothetical protein